MGESKERRKHDRITASYECFIYIRGKVHKCLTRDATPWGIGVYMDSQLEPEELVDLKIYIADAGFSMEVKGEVRHCIDNPDISTEPRKYLAGIALTEAPLKELPEVEVSRHTPSQSVRIEAHPKRCYEMISNYKRYPEWTKGVEKAEVTEFYGDGRGRRVKFVHNFFLRKVTYILDYSYDDDNLILSWVSAGGDKDILKITGSYTFEELGGNATLATYKLDISVSFFATERLVQYITSILMRKEVQNFKKFVEKNVRRMPRS